MEIILACIGIIITVFASVHLVGTITSGIVNKKSKTLDWQCIFISLGIILIYLSTKV